MNHRTGVGRGVAAAVLVLAALLVAGCGVPLDSSPQAIKISTTSTTVATTTGTGDPANAVKLYYLQGTRLEAYTETLDTDPTVQVALSQLLTNTAPAGMSTSIPPNTRLIGVSTDGQRVMVNLSQEIEGIVSDAERIAYAQLTFTVLQFRQYTDVTFLIDGKAIDAPTDDGNIRNVTALDYQYPLNPN